MNFKWMFAFALFFTFSIRSLVLANDDTFEGYREKAWGASLKSFRSSEHALPASFVDRVEARAIDYLMMDFHEVDIDDAARPTKFSDQRIAGDKTDYVFYNGYYQVAVVPIDTANEAVVKKQLDSKYKSIGSKSYAAYWDFKADYGWEMMRYDYRQYQKSPGTRVYWVEASSYLADGSLEDARVSDSVAVLHNSAPSVSRGGFLIYVSDDYFKSSANAWADYQTNKKAMPEKGQAAKEERRQQDLSSIE
jgi:hypothetical protein